MKIYSSKIYDLLLALYIVYLRNNPDMVDEFDYIERPNIEYVNKIITEFSKYDCNELFKYISCFNEISIPINIAIGLTENYEIDQNIMKVDYINSNMNYGSLNDFVLLLKEFALKVDWNKIYNKNRFIYNELINEFDKIDYSKFLTEINNFYGNESKSYNFIISIFMNGGFGIKDNQGNLYYIKGFKYNMDKFEYDMPFIIECMFHEFSHPSVNPLIDKYYELFSIDKIYQEAIDNGFPKCYQDKKIFLYEYFVRANANVLVNKFYPNTKIEDWIINYGFIHLQDLSDYIYNHYKKYDKFEHLFINELIDYFNNMNDHLIK